MIRNFAIIGLVGGLFVFIDKVFFSGLDFSAGFTSARFKGADLGTQFSSSYYRSPFLYPGLIMYSFSLISFTLYIINFETLPRWCLVVSSGSLISPFLVSLAYGGRSTLFLALVLPVGAVIVRLMKGKRTVSGLGWAIPVFLLIVLLVGFYDSRIQSDRRRFQGVTSYQTELRYDETFRGFRIKPWAKELIDSGLVPPGSALQIVSLDVYTLQGPVNLDRAVHYPGRLGPYFGQYEITSLGPVLGRTLPHLSVVDRMYSELGRANILGVFVTTWGALYVDFGWIGALLVTLAWGWLGTRVWYKAISTDHLGAQVACCFVVLSVISSPIHSVVGTGAGTFLLLDVLIAYRMMRPVPRADRPIRHALDSPKSSIDPAVLG